MPDPYGLKRVHLPSTYVNGTEEEREMRGRSPSVGFGFPLLSPTPQGLLYMPITCYPLSPLQNRWEEVRLKLELDKQSRILGTYRVRSRGVVSGLSAWESREVLIVLLPPPEVSQDEVD